MFDECDEGSGDEVLKGIRGAGELRAQVFSQIEAIIDFVSNDCVVSLLTKSRKKSTHCTANTGRGMQSTRGGAGAAAGGGDGGKRMCVAGRKVGRVFGGGQIDLGFVFI